MVAQQLKEKEGGRTEGEVNRDMLNYEGLIILGGALLFLSCCLCD